jgi:hypothetical protein
MIARIYDLSAAFMTQTDYSIRTRGTLSTFFPAKTAS